MRDDASDPITSTNPSLTLLIQQQQPDGSFLITSSSGAPPSLATRLVIHALLLSILSKGSLSESVITQRLVQWLLSKVWKDSDQHFSTDDTLAIFQSLTALQDHDEHLVSQEMIAVAVRHLITVEVEPGGPYQNAAQPKIPPDIATNVAIARFLQHVANPLPKLQAFLATRPWPNRHFTYDWPLQLGWEWYTQTIATPQPSVLQTQHVYHEPGQNDTFGSLALAAAIALMGTKKLTKTPAVTDADPYESLTPLFKKQVATMPTQLQPHVLAMLNRVVRADTHQEIGPLALRFSASLRDQVALPKEVLQTLGLANLFTWAAYTIYDDFYDEEGDPVTLATANAAHRQALLLFKQALPQHTAFHQLVDHTFDTMDTANAWEIRHSRFRVRANTVYVGKIPRYASLQSIYNRSLAHSLPVIGTLAAAGWSLETAAVQDIIRGFTYYLTVRQLSDDLRDWQEDLAAGHISPVVARQLSDLRLPPGPYRLNRLIPQLEQHFWHHCLKEISHELYGYADRGRHYLQQSNILTPDNVITQLIDGLEQALQRTLAEQDAAQHFLNAYRR